MVKLKQMAATDPEYLTGLTRIVLGDYSESLPPEIIQVLDHANKKKGILKSTSV